MADKRRLLVVSHGFPPYYGGAEHAAGHLAAAAAACGRWVVTVLTSDIGGRLPSRENWRGVDVVRVRARKKAWRNHSVAELLSFLIAAGRPMPIARPDWILAHFTLPGGAVARRWAGRFQAPYAVVLHGADVPDSDNGRFGAVYPLVKPLVRRVWRQAARVIAVSATLRNQALRTWPGGRIDIVPNGVDVDRFRPRDLANSARNDGLLVLLATARLAEFKGLQHLLAAVALLPEEWRRRTRVCLCGQGPFEGELRRQAQAAGLEQQVEFAGLVPYADVPARLREADVFVLPSLREGMPLAVLEAMASGVPVVASTVGGIPDVVRDGANGVLVPPGDPGALRDAIARLAADPGLRLRLGAAARREAMARSWALIWQRYEALFVADSA